MTQAIPIVAQLGPGATGLTIGYRVLNLDASNTVYSAFTTTGVTETSIPGNYRHNGVVLPDLGGRVIFGTALEDHGERSFGAKLNDPSITSIIDAIKAYEVESGHSFDTVMKRIYALNRGKSVADDPNPTEVDYYAPDGTTVRVHHDLTDTSREPS